jgi:hypothetical protein
MNAMSLNGRKRPTLSEQIGRLDNILDGLAANLNEAVADAVKEAVGVAVKEAIQSILTEVLTNPELLAKLRPETAKPAPVAPAAMEKWPSWWTWLTGLALVACKKVANTAKFVCGKTVEAAKQVGAKIATMAGSWWTTICANWRSVGSRLKMLAGGGWVFLRVVGGIACRFRKPLLIALGVGSAVGMCCHFAGPVVASTVSGLAGFAGSLFGSALNGLRRAIANLELENA